VSKLDPAGSALVYSTYLGNGWPTGGSGIAVDAAGNAYVTGSTNSTNFPTTVGAFQPVFRGGVDAFVTKLNPTGSALVYSTYLGGSRDDQGSGIAVDVNGYAYVTGKTGPDPFFACPEDIPNSIQPRCLNDFPTSLGPQPIYGGGTHDAFVSKLDPTGSLLIYSTYLGGIKTDSGNAIAVDTHDNAYVIGQTFSSNFPTTAGAFQPSFGGGGDGIMSDAFVAKIVNVVPPPLPPLP